MATILILEPDESVSASLSEAIEQVGLRTIVQENAADVADLLSVEPPALIVLDLAIEDGRGVDLCHQIRDTSGGELLPILMLGTGEEGVKSFGDALAEGGDYYFDKPLDHKKLISKILTYVGVDRDAPTVVAKPPEPAPEDLAGRVEQMMNLGESFGAGLLEPSDDEAAAETGVDAPRAGELTQPGGPPPGAKGSQRSELLAQELFDDADVDEPAAETSLLESAADGATPPEGLLPPDDGEPGQDPGESETAPGGFGFPDQLEPIASDEKFLKAPDSEPPPIDGADEDQDAVSDEELRDYEDRLMAEAAAEVAAQPPSAAEQELAALEAGLRAPTQPADTLEVPTEAIEEALSLADEDEDDEDDQDLEQFERWEQERREQLAEAEVRRQRQADRERQAEAEWQRLWELERHKQLLATEKRREEAAAREREAEAERERRWEEQRQQQLAEAERKARALAEAEAERREAAKKRKEEEARKRKEEEERKRKEEEERKRKEEEARKRKEEEERKRKEEEARKRKDEEERKRKEEEEERKRKEEEARKRKEEEERKRKEEEERKRKEEEERKRKEEEERKRKEEEERKRKEEEARKRKEEEERKRKEEERLAQEEQERRWEEERQQQLLQTERRREEADAREREAEAERERRWEEERQQQLAEAERKARALAEAEAEKNAAAERRTEDEQRQREAEEDRAPSGEDEDDGTLAADELWADSWDEEEVEGAEAEQMAQAATSWMEDFDAAADGPTTGAFDLPPGTDPDAQPPATDHAGKNLVTLLEQEARLARERAEEAPDEGINEVDLAGTIPDLPPHPDGEPTSARAGGDGSIRSRLRQAEEFDRVETEDLPRVEESDEAEPDASAEQADPEQAPDAERTPRRVPLKRPGLRVVRAGRERETANRSETDATAPGDDTAGEGEDFFGAGNLPAVMPPDPETTDLATESVPAVLWRLHVQAVSGTVTFRSAGDHKQVFFERGIPVGVRSSQTADRLEEILYHQGLIDREAYAEARVKGLDRSRALAAHLVERGLLRPEELFPTVRRHLEDCLLGLFEWRTGRASYEPVLAPDAEMVRLAMPVGALVVEGLRRKFLLPRMMEEMGGPASLLAPIPAEDRGPEVPDPRTLGLSQRETEILRLVDGLRPIEEIVFLSGHDVSTVYQVLLAAVVLGLARVAVRGLHSADTDPEQARQRDVDIRRRRLEAKFEQIHNASYFDILGVTPKASPYEIKTAFERLAREFHELHYSHPALADLATKLDVVQRTLVEARDVLSDELLREGYRSALSQDLPPTADGQS